MITLARLATVLTTLLLPQQMLAVTGIAPANNRIAYSRLTSFDATADTNFGPTAISADGSRLVYSTSARRIYTMQTNGGGWSKIFDYADVPPTSGAGATPYVAINADGSRVAWTNGFDHIYIANFDGTGRIETVSLLNVGGGDVEPRFDGTRFKFALDGKLYFLVNLGTAQSQQPVNGIYRVNADGTAPEQILSNAQLTIHAPPVPDKPDRYAAVTYFDVCDDGTRIVGSYNMGYYGGALFPLPGSIFTWNSGALDDVDTAHSEIDNEVAISGDGATIAYVFEDANVAMTNDFAGTVEATAYANPVFNMNIDINQDGSLMVINESGSESSSPVAVVNPKSPAIRLDLMPDHVFRGARSARMDSCGRMLWITGWTSPHSSGGGGISAPVSQVMIVDLNPVVTAEFPQISGHMAMPYQIDRVARAPMAGSARISGTFGEVTMATHRGGVMRENFAIDSINDDGETSDIVGGDTVYTGHFIPYSNGDARYPPPGSYTLRVTAANPAIDRILAVDGIGPQVFDGPPPDDSGDEDGDGINRLLEEAFVLDPAASDTRELPRPEVIEDGGEFYPGVIFRVAVGGVFDVDLNLYRAGDFTYFIEISSDLLHWRRGDATEIVFLSAVPNGDGSESVAVRFTTPIRDLTATCYLRPVILRGGAPLPGASDDSGNITGTTVLTFDGFDNSYGARVNSATNGTQLYGGSGLFTPSVDARYSNVSPWASNYGDLVNVIYPRTETLDIRLDADAGFTVGVTGLDLATFSSSDQVIGSVSVLGRDGAVLWSQADVTVPTDGHLSIDLGPDPPEDTTLTIRIDAENLGGGRQDIGIDNVGLYQRKLYSAPDWSVLLFEADGLGNGTPIDGAYGDRITGMTNASFHYAGGGNFTPNVTTEYLPEPRHYTLGYGDLQNVLYPGHIRPTGMTIVLRADPGFEVQLNGFDMASFVTLDPIRAIKIFDGQMRPLHQISDVPVPGEGRLAFDFTAAPPQADTIILRTDSANLPFTSSDEVGIDNVSFSQVAVP